MIYIPSQKSRLEEQTNIDEGEDVAFTKLAELAREANEDKWESKVDKYVKDGLTEEEARMKGNRKLNDEDLEQFMSRYASLIQYILQLKDGRLHLKVMKLVDELVQNGMDYNKAKKIAIRKYKHMLEISLMKSLIMKIMKKARMKRTTTMVTMMRQRRRRTNMYKRTLFFYFFHFI